MSTDASSTVAGPFTGLLAINSTDVLIDPFGTAVLVNPAARAVDNQNRTGPELATP